eukprot:4237412-Amphidinium_carterae.1
MRGGGEAWYSKDGRLWPQLHSKVEPCQSAIKCMHNIVSSFQHLRWENPLLGQTPKPPHLQKV